MKVEIDYKRALSRHPVQTTEAIAQLRGKVVKAKLQMPPVAELKWSYSWAVGIGAGCTGSALDNVYPSLCAELGRRQAYARLVPQVVPGQPATPMRRKDVPPEIVAAHAPLPKVSAKNTPHVAQIALTHRDGGTQTGLVIFGYRAKSGTYLQVTIAGVDDHRASYSPPGILYKVSGSDLIWSGMLHRSAMERLNAAAEGALFRYRNAPFTRLTTQEIAVIANGGPFKVTM